MLRYTYVTLSLNLHQLDLRIIYHMTLRSPDSPYSVQLNQSYFDKHYKLFANQITFIPPNIPTQYLSPKASKTNK